MDFYAYRAWHQDGRTRLSPLFASPGPAGRWRAENHPDMGVSLQVYDAAGHETRPATAEEISRALYEAMFEAGT